MFPQVGFEPGTSNLLHKIVTERSWVRIPVRATLFFVISKKLPIWAEQPRAKRATCNFELASLALMKIETLLGYLQTLDYFLGAWNSRKQLVMRYYAGNDLGLWSFDVASSLLTPIKGLSKGLPKGQFIPIEFNATLVFRSTFHWGSLEYANYPNYPKLTKCTIDLTQPTQSQPKPT